MISTSTTVGKKPSEENGVALTVNRSVQNAVLGCNLKNDRVILVHFQANHSTIIQGFAPTTDAKEAEVD